MARYDYTAIVLGSGKEEQGVVDATSVAEATATLRRRDLAPIEMVFAADLVKPSVEPREVPRARLLQLFSRGVGPKQLAVFARQLATLVNAGLPVTRALDVLARQERQPTLRGVLHELSSTISGGGNLSDGLRRHPALFDRLFVNMVKAGEAGGALGVVLDRLAQFQEKHERLKARVKSAMIYPLIIMGVAATILAVLMVVVVPKFEQIFTGLLKGHPLPAATRGLLGVSHFIGGHYFVVIGLTFVVGTLFRFLRKSERGTRVTDWLLLRSPVVGDLVLKTSVARFARTLGALLSSGVSLLEALVITRNTAGNLHVAAALDHVHDRIKQGDTIAAPLEATGMFPNMVTGMIQVGEETGALPEMLIRIADTYDEEVDTAVSALTAAIEPVMIVVMALVVGGIVIALFLPIVGIIQQLQ